MKIAFHSEQLDIRGTCVSLYDYAHYFETLLHGSSIILACRHGKHDENAIYKFNKRFQIRYYDNKQEIDKLVTDCDIFYTIAYGKYDYLPKGIKTCVHCVFDLSEPHGDVYVAVSDTLAKKFNYTEFVPHMIGLKPSRLKDNLRSTFGIPHDAVVIGRHGGLDTFDLRIAMASIIRAIYDRPNLYFIFVNTPQFYKHDRIHYIEKIVDFDEKNRFIMSCDAMIHAQSLGETFGIAIGEFSINNKPIISYNGPVWNDHYKTVLSNKALWYTTEDECYNILLNFSPDNYKNNDMNCYKEYSPEIVMEKFKKVFID